MPTKAQKVTAQEEAPPEEIEAPKPAEPTPPPPQPEPEPEPAAAKDGVIDLTDPVHRARFTA